MASLRPIAGVEARPIAVAVIDDHEIVREAVRTYLEGDGVGRVVLEAGSAKEAIDAIDARPQDIDVAIVDVRLPDGSGLWVCRHLSSRHGIRCLVFTSVGGDTILSEALSAGAEGVLNKAESSARLVEAVRRVARGEQLISRAERERLGRLGEIARDRLAVIRQFNDRERSIARLTTLGWTNRQIADELDLAEKTVRNYLSQLFTKLDAQNRTELAAIVNLAVALGEFGNRDPGAEARG